MARQTLLSEKSKKKRGPAPTGVGTLIGVRLLPPNLSALDAWIARQPEARQSRPEAIRRLIERALAAEGLSAAKEPAKPLKVNLAYSATRRTSDGKTVAEWLGVAEDDTDAANRLAQRLKAKLDANVAGYRFEDRISLLRPDGGTVAVEAAGEFVRRMLLGLAWGEGAP